MWLHTEFYGNITAASRHLYTVGKNSQKILLSGANEIFYDVVIKVKPDSYHIIYRVFMVYHEYPIYAKDP